MFNSSLAMRSFCVFFLGIISSHILLTEGELAASGKAIFEANCALCHGSKGKGDTATGKALKARDFTKDPFKQGDSVADIVNTLKKSVPGTAMRAFPELSESQKKAVAQYVVSLRKGVKPAASKSTSTSVQPKAVEKVVEKVTEIKDQVTSTFAKNVSKSEPVEKTVSAVVSAISHQPKASSAQTSHAKSDAKEVVSNESDSNRVSITYAMSRLAQKKRKALKQNFINSSAGYQVFAKNCSSCHGANGQGGVAVKVLSAAPYYRLETEALIGHDGYWLNDINTFAGLVTKGLPGGFMPGNATLTKKEVGDLYDYMKSKAGAAGAEGIDKEKLRALRKELDRIISK